MNVAEQFLKNLNRELTNKVVMHSARTNGEQVFDLVQPYRGLLEFFGIDSESRVGTIRIKTQPAEPGAQYSGLCEVVQITLERIETKERVIPRCNIRLKGTSDIGAVYWEREDHKRFGPLSYRSTLRSVIPDDWLFNQKEQYP